MDKKRFKKELKGLGLNLTRFSDWVGVPYATTKAWGRREVNGDVRPLPKWALLILKLESDNRTMQIRIGELLHELSIKNGMVRAAERASKNHKKISTD